MLVVLFRNPPASRTDTRDNGNDIAARGVHNDVRAMRPLNTTENEMSFVTDSVAKVRYAFAAINPANVDNSLRSATVRGNAAIMNGVNVLMHGGTALAIATGNPDVAFWSGAATAGLGVLKFGGGILQSLFSLGFRSSDKSGGRMSVDGLINIAGGVLGAGSEYMAPGVGAAVNGALAAFGAGGVANSALPSQAAPEKSAK